MYRERLKDKQQELKWLIKKIIETIEQEKEQEDIEDIEDIIEGNGAEAIDMDGIDCQIPNQAAFEKVIRTLNSGSYEQDLALVDYSQFDQIFDETITLVNHEVNTVYFIQNKANLINSLRQEDNTLKTLHAVFSDIQIQAQLAGFIVKPRTLILNNLPNDPIRDQQRGELQEMRLISVTLILGIFHPDNEDKPKIQAAGQYLMDRLLAQPKIQAAIKQANQKAGEEESYSSKQEEQEKQEIYSSEQEEEEEQEIYSSEQEEQEKQEVYSSEQEEEEEEETYTSSYRYR